MTEMDTQLACVKFQTLIYKMERYQNIFHMHNLFFPLVAANNAWQLARFTDLNDKNK